MEKQVEKQQLTQAQRYAEKVADYYDALCRRMPCDFETVRQLTLEYQRRLMDWGA